MYDNHHQHRQIIILTLIIFSTVYAAQHDTYLTHFEDPSKDLYLFDSFTDKDGMLLIQFVHYNNPEQTCIDPDINLRIIFPDGTIKSLEIAYQTHQIPSYNFCMLDDVFVNYFLNKFTILLTYFNGEDKTTTIHMGMTMDFDGKILQ